MASTTNKTTENTQSVDDFIDGIQDEQKRADSHALKTLMTSVTGQKPVMWGDSIVGFGKYHYRYASGREGDFLRVGFSPRKASLSIYLLDESGTHKKALENLGPHKTAVSCLYIKRLSDVDTHVLESVIRQSYENQDMGEEAQ